MASEKLTRFSPTKILLGLGLISSALAWLLIAPPVITFNSTAKHPEHFGLVYFHVLGGTIMLFLGLANLYIGTTRKHFNYHKLLGRIYLIGGGLGAIAAIVILSSPAHKAAGVSVFTNVSISLLRLHRLGYSPPLWLIGLCGTSAMTRTVSGSFAATCLLGHLSFVALPVEYRV